MKKYFLLTVGIMLASLSLSAQTEPDWTRVLQATTYNLPAGRVVAADASNIYMAGNISGPITFENTTYTATGKSDMMVFKLSSSGNVIWARQINAKTNGTISPEAMKLDANQNLFIVGSFSGQAMLGNSVITSDYNAFIAKFDPSGNALWATAFSTSDISNSKIAFDANGNCYLISRSRSLLKFNSSGIKLWEQYYPDRTLQAIAVSGSNLYIGGALQQGTTTFGKFKLESSNAYNTGFLAKADLDGVFSKVMVERTTSLSTKDGSYRAVGTFVHPTEGTRIIDQTKTLTGSDENVLSTSVGDLAPEQGTLVLTINPDNTVTISGSVGILTLTQSGVNLYDPVAKTFTLNYSYLGVTGAKVISEVFTKSTSTSFGGDGSAISDIAIDINGNLIITGAFTSSLTLGATTVTKPKTSHYTFIAKCNTDFAFEWINTSDAISNTREMYSYRLFQDNENNIYQYGLSQLGATTFTYGSVSVSQQPQFLFIFDANGEVQAGYGLQNTSVNRIVVSPDKKIVITGTVSKDVTASFGNFFVAQYNIFMNPEWQKNSSNHQAGTIDINYVKHDAAGNTYAQARIQGYCNFFGSVINSNSGTTVNAKFDKSGNAVWMNLINDLYSSSDIYGPKFSLDKDNNLLTVGSFNTTLNLGAQNFTNSNTSNDGYIVKYDPNGQVRWVVQLKTEGSHSIYAITSDKAGNVIVSGEFRNQLTVGNKTIDAGTVDGAFVIKLDAAGNCLWVNGYPIGDDVWEAMVSTDENNNIYMTGEMYNYTSQQLVFGSLIVPQTTDDGGTVLVKLNPDGIEQWAYTYGGVAGASSANGWPVDIKTDASGNTYLWGWCVNNASFGTTTLVNPFNSLYSYFIAKINTSGVVVWANAVYEKQYSSNYGDMLDLDKNGNIYVGGHFRDVISIQGTSYNPLGINDFFVAKYNNNGKFQWIKNNAGQ